MSIIDKYDAMADRYSAVDYADAATYYRRRASLVVEHGPTLAPGSAVLDVACGDGGLGRALLDRGIDYHGVDASPRMVEVARRSLGDRVTLATFDYLPPAQVDATTIFRSLYLVPNRREFLHRTRAYTRGKLVFDFDPRAYRPDEVLRDLRDAGWERVEIRPFLTPQRARVPRPLQALLWAVEPLPGSRALTKIRFPLLVSASRPG
jgi:ubiquinone/menaquinone biosynthesis C-methylase UbiE